MRPQDIVVLLKIISINDQNWQNKDLASSLYISPSEISEALNRNHIAGLLDFKKRRVNRQSLVEFIKHGLRYVFPQKPEAMVNGIPTAHSHPFMKRFFDSDTMYVWADSSASSRGLSIEPLYANQVKAVREDEKLYKLLALIDVIRVGRTRETKIAEEELTKIMSHESTQ